MSTVNIIVNDETVVAYKFRVFSHFWFESYDMPAISHIRCAEKRKQELARRRLPYSSVYLQKSNSAVQNQLCCICQHHLVEKPFIEYENGEEVVPLIY